MLKSALIELLQKKPLSQLTIKDVCEKADLNRTTFYLHYSHLNDLMLDIEKTAETQIMEYVQSIRAEADKVTHIALLLEYIRENSAIFRVLLNGAEDDPFQKKLFHHISGIPIKSTIAGLSDDQTRYAKIFTTYGCLGLVRAWFERDFDMAPVELAQQIFDMCAGAYRRAIHSPPLR